MATPSTSSASPPSGSSAPAAGDDRRAAALRAIAAKFRGQGGAPAAEAPVGDELFGMPRGAPAAPASPESAPPPTAPAAADAMPAPSRAVLRQPILDASGAPVLDLKTGKPKEYEYTLENGVLKLTSGVDNDVETIRPGTAAFEAIKQFMVSQQPELAEQFAAIRTPAPRGAAAPKAEAPAAPELAEGASGFTDRARAAGGLAAASQITGAPPPAESPFLVARSARAPTPGEPAEEPMLPPGEQVALDFPPTAAANQMPLTGGRTVPGMRKAPPEYVAGPDGVVRLPGIPI